ncbi:hypothetical protein ACNOYE_32445 [Nannocystaceae bacterium ST9]
MSRLSSACAIALVLASFACADTKRTTITEGQVSRMQKDQYIRDAVRMSSEGVVLEPASNIDAIDRRLLVEYAQAMRAPLAICFLERAINTMEPGEVDGEEGWVGVPEGQAKVRARVGANGVVLATDVLESGFDDDEMEACVRKAIENQRFLPSRDAFAYHIDVFYWVSLGFFRTAQTAEFDELMRRQQTTAGIAAKNCITGRAPAGEYRIRGLNLFDRDGNTVINRIERGDLSPEVGSCIAAAFKAIRIPAEPEAFVRPAAPVVTFTVAGDGSIAVSDERWLALIEKEEQAIREARKAELLDQPVGADAIEPDHLELPEDAETDGGASEPSEPLPPQKDDVPPAQGTDPGGMKIDLSPRRRR